MSVGVHDHVKPALAELGVGEAFWGVALKPGKPTSFGVLGERLVFGLSGNPVSAMVAFHLFVRPALRRLAGTDPHETRAHAILDQPVQHQPGRVRRSPRSSCPSSGAHRPIEREPDLDQVLRCRLQARADGWHVEPTKKQGSHVLTSMLGARAFALIEAGEGTVGAGERVPIEILV